MNFGGPQSLRDKTWLRKPAELTSEREELIIDRQAEKQVYEGELTRIRKENIILRDQLQRCHNELRYYQVKYPNEVINIHNNENIDDDLPPWVTSSEHMTPLLQVYDERIAELQKELAHQREMVDSFQEKMEEILAENEALRETQFQNLQQNNDGMNPLGPHNIELINELNERLQILVNENALLVEEKAELTSENEEHINELELRTNTVKTLSNQLGALSQEIQINRQNLAQAEKDREDSAAQLLKINDKLHQTEIELSDCKEQLSVWEERCLNAEKNASDFEKELKQLTRQNEEDGLNAMRRLKIAEDRVKELKIELLQKTQELDNAQDVARKLRREYQNTRQDAQGMLQVMSGLEKQLAEYSSREAEIERISRENKEKLEEAYVIRDQSLTREEQLKRDIDRLHEDRKKAALQKQNEIEAAVEVAKSVAAGQISSLEHDLEEMSGRITRVKAESDRITREYKSSQMLLEKSRQSMEDERKVFDQSIRKLEEKLRELTLIKEESLMKVKTVQDMNTDLRLTIDKLRTQEDNSRNVLDERDRYKDKEIEKLRSSLREVQRENVDLTTQLNRKQAEFSEYKDDIEKQLSNLQNQKDDEVETYRKRCSDAEQTVKEMELIVNSENHRAKLLIEQFKEKANILHLQMETKMVENKERIKQLTDKLRELDERYKDLELSKSQLMTQLEEIKGKYYTVQEQNKEYEHEIQDLTNQLTFNLERKERELNMKKKNKYFSNKKGSLRRQDEQKGMNIMNDDYDNDDNNNQDDDDSINDYEIENIMKDIKED